MAQAFTVTEVTYNFTATVTTPLEVALVGTDTSVIVSQSTASISVINTRQPVTVSVPGGGASYNQSLNTTDNVSFATVTAAAIYGAAGQPVQFPTGISVENFGTVFSGALDFGSIYAQYTNILSLLLAAAPIDMGTITLVSQFNLNFGTIS